MAVTAKFVPERIEVLPNAPTAVTLRLYNGDDRVRHVALTVIGDLAGHVTLETLQAQLETNQIVDVTMTIDVPSTLEAGQHAVSVEVSLGTSMVAAMVATEMATDGGENTPSVSDADPAPAPMAVAPMAVEPVATEPATAISTVVESPVVEPTVVVASLAVDVVAHYDYSTELRPSHTHGSSAGRHSLYVANTGNVAIALEVAIDDVTDGATADVGATAISVAPGATAGVVVRIIPNSTYWSGPAQNFDFVVRTTSADGRVDEHIGSYEQRPRVPNWIGPAAAGALAALVIGAVVWFAFLRPWVQDTAEDAANDAIELDRAALQQRIDDLEAATRDAKELPLGAPTNVRLDVAPAAGNVEEVTADVGAGAILSITDVVLENPTGAAGLVTLRRDGEVLLQSELANFRDFDRHFVAPFVFDDRQQIVLSVDCRTPGPGGSDCPVGASLVGFVDNAG